LRSRLNWRVICELEKLDTLVIWPSEGILADCRSRGVDPPRQ